MSQDSPTIRKAALLVASLDAATADTLLDQLPAEQADLVRRAVASLIDIEASEQDEVIVEFMRIGPRHHAEPPEFEPGHPGIELDDGLARRLGIDPARPLDRPAASIPTSSPPFRFLEEASSDRLAALLSIEHPQTVALVVSHLPSERAIEVVADLPEAMQAEVLNRLVDLDEAHPEIVREVERGLESRFARTATDQRRQSMRMDVVSRILHAADPSMEREILDNLSRHDPRLAARLHRRSPAFDDLAALDDAGLRAVLAAADPDVARLALAAARPELLERVLRLFPARQARAMRHALEHLGPTPLRDLEAAQQELVDAARRLEAEGRINWSRPSGQPSHATLTHV
jgi:flagellar motor switch protein FliG